MCCSRWDWEDAKLSRSWSVKILFRLPRNKAGWFDLWAYPSMHWRCPKKWLHSHYLHQGSRRAVSFLQCLLIQPGDPLIRLPVEPFRTSGIQVPLFRDPQTYAKFYHLPPKTVPLLTGTWSEVAGSWPIWVYQRLTCSLHFSHFVDGFCFWRTWRQKWRNWKGAPLSLYSFQIYCFLGAGPLKK